MERFLAALTRRPHVHLVDKEFFLVTRIVDLFLGQPSYPDGARPRNSVGQPSLYRVGRRGGRDWDAFFAAFVELVRVKRQREQSRLIVDRLFQACHALVRHGLGAPATDDAPAAALLAVDTPSAKRPSGIWPEGSPAYQA